MLNILDNEIAIEKIRKYTTLTPKEITNRVTPSLNAKRNILFKEITDIDNAASMSVELYK